MATTTKKTTGLTKKPTTITKTPPKVVNAKTGATASVASQATAPPMKNPYTTAPQASPYPVSTVTQATPIQQAQQSVAQAQMAATPAPPGNSPGLNQGTTDPLNGAIGGYGYTPMGAGTLYDNPQALATDILKGMGINNPGLANSLAQSLDPAVAAQFLLNNGKNSSDADTLNFANQYMQQMVTPGGRTPEMDALVDHLLSGTNENTSPLGAYLNAGLDPAHQVSAANSLFGLTTSGQNPYAQQGYLNYAKDLGSQYQGEMAKANPKYTSYIDYLNKASKLGSWTNGS